MIYFYKCRLLEIENIIREIKALNGLILHLYSFFEQQKKVSVNIRTVISSQLCTIWYDVKGSKLSWEKYLEPKWGIVLKRSKLAFKPQLNGIDTQYKHRVNGMGTNVIKFNCQRLFSVEISKKRIVNNVANRFQHWRLF
jgi:hypothetical protein